MAAPPLATAAELRTYLDLEAGELTDARAELILAGVSGLVRDWCNQLLTSVDDDVVHLSGKGATTLLLPETPVVAVTSVAEDPAGENTALAGPDDDSPVYEWDDDGILTRIDGGVWRRRARWYVVTYDHGFADDSDELERIKQVVLRVAARAVVNPEGLTQEGAEGYSASYGADTSRLASLSPADRADLARYRVDP
jgi:hypothetical protein